jgi:hypothetical protein
VVTYLATRGGDSRTGCSSKPAWEVARRKKFKRVGSFERSKPIFEAVKP